MIAADRDDSATTDFTLLQTAAGQPYEWRDAEQSYAAYQIVVADANGALHDLVVYAECQTLVPGEAVFGRYYAGPSAVFEQWYADDVETIVGVFLPASAWLSDDPDLASAGYAPFWSDWRRGADVIVDDEGTPELFVGQADSSVDTRGVIFENIGSRPLVVEPANLVLTLREVFSSEDFGDVLDHQRPVSIPWEDGFASDDGSRLLAPGERATVQVRYGDVDASGMNCDNLPLLELNYASADGDLAQVAQTEIASCGEVTDIDVGAPEAAGQPVLLFGT